MHAHTKFQRSRTIRGEVILRRQNGLLVLRNDWTELSQIWGGHRPDIGASQICLDVPYFSLFLNQSNSNDKFRTF